MRHYKSPAPFCIRHGKFVLPLMEATCVGEHLQGTEAHAQVGLCRSNPSAHQLCSCLWHLDGHPDSLPGTWHLAPGTPALSPHPPSPPGSPSPAHSHTTPRRPVDAQDDPDSIPLPHPCVCDCILIPPQPTSPSLSLTFLPLPSLRLPPPPASPYFCRTPAHPNHARRETTSV